MTLYNEDKALAALKSIADPLTGGDIISAGRISDIAHKGGVVRMVLEIPVKKAAMYEAVRGQCEVVLEQLEGIDKAQVILTASQLAPDLKKPVRPHQARRPVGYQGDQNIDQIIAISAAKGGVGKSTLAVNLAVALSRLNLKVGILDCDIYGPSLPVMMGLAGQSAQLVKKHGRSLIAPLVAHGVKVMSIGFLTPDEGPVVWRGAMVQGAMGKMLWDVDWGNLDRLVIDMPPGTGDAQLALAQDIRPHQAVIVSTPQALALADVKKGVKMFYKVDIPIIGLVENMSHFVCPECGAQHALFGVQGGVEVADELGLSLLGQVPLALAIRESADTGLPIAAGQSPQGQAFLDIGRKLLKRSEL